MSRPRTAEEELRGCRENSTLYPIALEVKERFLRGESIRAIGETYAHLGVTAAMVSGHIHRNGIKRDVVGLSLAEQSRIEANRKRAEEMASRKQVMKAVVAKTPKPPKPEKPVEVVAKEPKPEPKQPTLRVIPMKPGDGLSILAMRTFGQCWFHVGPTPAQAADQLFCGRKTNGSTFCDDHAEIAYQPPEAKRRIRA